MERLKTNERQCSNERDVSHQKTYTTPACEGALRAVVENRGTRNPHGEEGGRERGCLEERRSEAAVPGDLVTPATGVPTQRRGGTGQAASGTRGA